MLEYGGLLLLLPVVGLLFLFLVLSNRNKEEKKKKPPGPPGLPIIGNLRQLDSLSHRKLSELSKRYGPLMHLQLGNIPMVVISSAELARTILKENDHKVCSRPSLTPARHISFDFSDVALSPYGAKRRELRKIIVVNLLNTKRVQELRRTREEEVYKMVASISSLVSLSSPINLSKQSFVLFNAIIRRVTIGRRASSADCSSFQTGYICSENKYNDAFREAQALTGEFYVGDFIPWAGWVDILTGLRARLKKNRTDMEVRCQEVIEAHTNFHGDSSEEEDVIDVLLRLQKEDNTNLTMNNIKGIIMDIFVGGTITSYATVEFAMAELIKNPKTMDRAQEEVRGVVGAKGKVEETDVSQLKYLKSVVKETLRLHPPVPLLIPRETMDSINVLGYCIPPKTMLMVNVWAIGRDPRMWENPLEFIPDRFIDSAMDYKGQDFQFTPFGSGRRMCPGLTFGIMAVELALANLLYTFDWKVLKGSHEDLDMDESRGSVCPLKNDLYLAATKYKY